jgi:hypothetical protein
MLAQIIAFVGWWALSKVEMDNDCDPEDYDRDDRLDLCTQEGLAFPVLACAFSIGAGLFAMINMKCQYGAPTYRISTQHKVGAVSYKCHYIILMSIVLVSAALSVAALVIREWIFYETAGDDRDGSLFSASEYAEVDNYGYDCIAVPKCDEDDDKWDCKTFEPLWEAGIVYLSL